MVDVSRETSPGSAPPQAREAFGDRLPLAERYAEILADAGVVRGLIGPREVPRLWERHLLNCVALADERLIPLGAELADVGSGAGLPGLVLAIARPDVAVTLVEPLLRRSEFLTEVVKELGLTNVEVVRSRAEELHGRRRFPVVTARAVAPLDRLARWCVPLLTRDGRLLAMKGDRAEAELENAEDVLRRLGGFGGTIQVVGGGTFEHPVRVAVIARQGR